MYDGFRGSKLLMASRTVWQSNQPLFNRILATPIQICINSNRRIRQPVTWKGYPFSGNACRSSIASTLLRSRVSPELFKNSRLLIKDEVELYSKRLGLRTGEIRLLFIVPDADLNSQIELLMVHCLLDEAPPYQALSYTGGYPFPHFHRDVEEEERSYQVTKIILVNGIEFPVKLNLYQALLRFRRTHPSVALWIDSICINEGDPIERPEQVRIMGEIYGKSKEVIIWLGEVASRSETNIALGMIKGIIKSFVSWYNVKNPSGFLVHWELMKRKAETTPDSVDQKLFWKWLQTDCQAWFDGIDLREMGVRTDPRACDALRKLLSMRWFGRVWTWQEKEVARKATVYIGDVTISWERLRLSMLLFMSHDLSDNRLTPVRVLPGRQYLHVLDSLNIADSPDLLDVVINVRHRSTQHRRDKIFGVLGALKPSADTEHFSQLLNYGYLQTPDLYKEFSRYWIKDKGDLRVLQACNPEKKIEELPSWVADWSDVSPSHQLTTRLYNATKDTKVKVEFHYHKNSNEIILRGIPIDTVKIVCHDSRLDNIESNFMNESAHWDPFREDLTEPFASLYIAGLYKNYMSSLLQGNWLKAGEKIQWDKPYNPTGEKMAEAFWRTLLVDHDIYARDDLNRRIPLTTDVTSIFDLFAHRKSLSRGLWPNYRRGKGARLRPRWIERLQSSLMYKRFFVTDSGLLGVAPSNVRVGDLVCVMLGGKVPFGLREMEGHYQLVEEAYLHGYMDGRAIDLAREGKLNEMDFRIR